MKLGELLKLIMHENYTVVLRSPLGQIIGIDTEIERCKLVDYLDYRVLAVDENWTIIVQN